MEELLGAALGREMAGELVRSCRKRRQFGEADRRLAEMNARALVACLLLSISVCLRVSLCASPCCVLACPLAGALSRAVVCALFLFLMCASCLSVGLLFFDFS